MIQILGAIITVACISGLAVIYEGALASKRWFLTRTRKRKPPASREGGEDEEDVND